MARKPNTETSTANLGFEAKLWLTAERASVPEGNERAHAAALPL